jgi:hypothetical protein
MQAMPISNIMINKNKKFISLDESEYFKDKYL